MAPPNAEGSEEAAPPLPDAEPSDPEAAEEATSTRAPQRRRRWLAILVAFGALAAGSPLLEELSDRREVVIRLDEPGRVTAISVNLRSGDEVLWGTARRFTTGQAPGQLTRSLPLAPGRYQVSLEVMIDGRARHLERDVDVADDASQVIIPVR